ncbi:hypothetical protein [Nostoc sp. UHCC 0870]|uniref:hypothetical protein n=1 Tax=Nostoc sp. UHCC 0870 TaxID=2914041 RepID=UPI001EDFF4CB|nr:hypothetical protein [Nostoc sp. UHCC 0870]UKP00981.1 hypothetical protein L6494_27915 [Nostoc sp. UHCC 0870]
MGWYYDGRGNPSPSIKASQRAARRAAREAAKARRNLERFQRKREAEQRHKQRQSALLMRELAKESKLRAKMQELELAKYEVQVYENRIDCLLSVHKECSEEWDWVLIRNSQPPIKPEKQNTHEIAAQLKLSQYKPTLCDKLFRRVKGKQTILANDVDEGRKTDILNYNTAISEYKEDYENWQNLVELSKQIITGDIEAYMDVIDMEKPFDDICELGSMIEFDIIDSSTLGVTVYVNSETSIPSEIKSLTKTGRLSTKKMPKARFYEIYQDYICGCVLRIAREMFALLPIETILITSIGELFNSQTGHTQKQSILSVAIPKNIFVKLNFDSLDPSDSMSNFLHRMKFQKTKGFMPIEALSISELKSQ